MNNQASSFGCSACAIYQSSSECSCDQHCPKINSKCML